MTNLISTEALAAEIAGTRLRILDASWHLPTPGAIPRDARAEYLNGHLSGARFADLDALSEQDSALPHMLPSAAAFEKSVRAFGVNRDSRIVVYDSLGLFSAARVWWMFKAFGHGDVKVLDGGLPKWLREGRVVESGEASIDPGDWVARFDPSAVVSLQEVQAAALVLDARSVARFQGEAPEPRPGLASGHMPNGRNLPYSRLLRDDGRLRPAPELRELFEQLGADKHTRVVTSCGSGVTAAIVTLALVETGHPAHALYDGSWTEYAMRCPSRIVTGPTK